MIKLHVCPSTLAEGFDTYSPAARKILFDGAKVSPFMNFPSPDTDNRESKAAVKNAGRISLSGAQPKFSVVVGADMSLRNTSLHLLEPRIFALDKGLFREGMDLSDTHSVGRAEFLEFGKRIGIPENMAKREIERFSQDSPLTDNLIERSFLSDSLKNQYRQSMNWRRKMLTF